MELFFILLTILPIINACFTAHVAGEKGHGQFAWFGAGFFFPIISLIAAAGLPDRKAENKAQAEAERRAHQEEELRRKEIKEAKNRAWLAAEEKRRKEDPMNFQSTLPPLPPEGE